MRKSTFIISVILMTFIGSGLAAFAQEGMPNDGCDPRFSAIADQAIVQFQGTGDLDILVLTDPLCWHCRLGHKLLREYPNLYHTVRLSFFPRRSFIGSDMAAWILEDNAASDKLNAMIDFAYMALKQPKTESLEQARFIVLSQFLMAFPDLLGDGSVETLYARLQKDHEAHVLQSAALANAAKLAGTPVLVAGKKLLVGYGANPWMQALEAKAYCE